MPERRKVLIELHDPAVIAPGSTDHPAPSLELDPHFEPVNVAWHPERGTATSVLRGEIDHDHVDALEAHPDVADVWHDFEFHLFSSGGGCSSSAAEDLQGDAPPQPYDCDFATAKGTLAEVADHVGAGVLWADGNRGQGVTVGIVGGGITAEGRQISHADTSQPDWSGKLIPRVTGGWREDWGTTGYALEWHGNAMATGVLGIAPEAELYDIRITGQGANVTEKGMISDAVRAYDWAIREFRATGRPQILNNSWGVYNPKSAPDYVSNPHHLFTRKVLEAIDAGMIVLFAAGNCGNPCPAPNCCGSAGPGEGIWGANGAEPVMTVVAANIRGEYIAYSSQGPAALTPRKPDFCATSHYAGYTPCDYGTSSACAVASGIAALLKSGAPTATQARIKTAMAQSARQIGSDTWNAYSGSGIVRADKAFSLLSSEGSGEA